jgi:hypothetical protein
MNSKKLYKTIALTIVLFTTSACSIKSQNSSSGTTSTTGVTPPVTPPNPTTRRCRIPVQYANETTHLAALEALAQAKVRKKETPTTMCVAAKTSPLKSFDASLRIEYEDNIGFRWVTLRSPDLVYSSQENNNFRLIYLDQYGYVELKATESTSGVLNGTIRIANISPYNSYLSDIQAFLDLIKTTCNTTPAKCLNPIFNVNPIEPPPTEAQIIQRAEEAFAGQHGAQPFTLGTVQFNSSAIESTLF